MRTIRVFDFEDLLVRVPFRQVIALLELQAPQLGRQPEDAVPLV